MSPRSAHRRGVRSITLVAIALTLSACGAAEPSGGVRASGAFPTAGAFPTPAQGSAATTPVATASEGETAVGSGAPAEPSGAPPEYRGPWPVPRWCQPDAAGVPDHGDVRLPILYYHRSQQPPPDFSSWSAARRADFITYDTLPGALALQLDWLSRNGYTTILPADLADHWSHGCRLPMRPVILTFDDGSPDWLTTILPLLRAHGMVAEFYVTLEAIARRTISWADVQTLATNGMGIGAHDVHHVQLAMRGPHRPPADEATMRAEVDGARQAIEEHIGVAPDSMAYVGGGFNPTLVGLVDMTGYQTARSVLHGLIQRWSDRLTLRVVRIGPYDDVTDRQSWSVDPGVPLFAAKVSGQTQ